MEGVKVLSNLLEIRGPVMDIPPPTRPQVQFNYLPGYLSYIFLSIRSNDFYLRLKKKKKADEKKIFPSPETNRYWIALVYRLTNIAGRNYRFI